MKMWPRQGGAVSFPWMGYIRIVDLLTHATPLPKEGRRPMNTPLRIGYVVRMFPVSPKRSWCKKFSSSNGRTSRS